MNKIGEFKNEYGELFLILKDENSFYLTGDETDWEPLRLLPNFMEGPFPGTTIVYIDSFFVNDGELEKIKEIINNE